MFGLPLIDIAVIFVYFLLVLWIGIWSYKRTQDQEGYFLGGRRFGKLVQTFAAFGQGTSADTATAVSTNVYVNGASGVWVNLAIIVATPFYWLIAPIYRRMRCLTLGDFFRQRYQSRNMSFFYILVSIVGLMGVVAMGINAMGKTVAGMTPKPIEAYSADERQEYELAQERIGLENRDFANLSDGEVERLRSLREMNPQMAFSYVGEKTLMVVMGLFVVVYGAAGGLRAAFYTDLLQGVFLIILSVLLLPFAIMKTNAAHGGEGTADAFRILHSKLPESALQLFGSPQAIDFTWYFILVWGLMSLLNVTIQPNILVAIGSAKDEFTGRFGFVTGNMIKRVVTVLWGLFSLFALLLYAGQIQDPDLVWGYATLDLLGPLKIGLVGLMIACLLSALMSTADMFMITGSSLFTNDFYAQVVRGKSEKHYILVARVFSGLFILGSVLIAASFSSLFDLIKFLVSFFSVFIGSFWMGLLWRRANRIGSWVSMGASTAVFLLLPFALTLLFPGMRNAESLLVQTEARVVERAYQATEGDVEERRERIRKWESGALPQLEKAPEPIAVGDEFAKTFEIEGRSLFWLEGIRVDASGERYGAGMFNLDLWLLYQLGVPLDQFVYAFNETLRFVIRILVPFLLVIVFGLFCKRDGDPRVSEFFIKLRVPVDEDRQKDKENLERAYAHPESTESAKLFPGTDWEFKRWNLVDAAGFLATWGGVLAILFIAWLVISGG